MGGGVFCEKGRTSANLIRPFSFLRENEQFDTILYVMVIRMRHTRAHTRNRRSHHALKTKKLAGCKKCGEPVLSHTVCAICGFYKGREVVDTLAKLTKQERKLKEKEAQAQEAKKPGKKKKT